MVPKGQPLAGTLIGISERGLDADGNILAFLIGGKTPGQFSLHRSDKFDVSDATLLPSGELLVLERKFSLLGGVGIRIRSIPMKTVAPGAVVDGPVIFTADLGNEVDNFEGIDAHVTPEGETVITLVSDDNFSMIQRNCCCSSRWWSSVWPAGGAIDASLQSSTSVNQRPVAQA